MATALFDLDLDGEDFGVRNTGGQLFDDFLCEVTREHLSGRVCDGQDEHVLAWKDEAASIAVIGFDTILVLDHLQMWVKARQKRAVVEGIAEGLYEGFEGDEVDDKVTGA